MRTDQQIRFLTTPDGARIAYSAIGQGPALLRMPPWLSHLDLEWKITAVHDFYQALARNHTVIRYDSLGCGLSDHSRCDFSLGSELRLLEFLVDSLDLEQCALFGYSAGGPLAVTYAARHPERVSNLILFGTLGYVGHTQLGSQIPPPLHALATDLWPLAARLIADLHAPDADGATLQALARLYFQASSGENAMRAARGLLYDIDVTELLPKLTVPCTVIHRVGDFALPYQGGRELAARIPNCSFVPLEGTSNLPFFGDTSAVLAAVGRALGDEQLLELPAIQDPQYGVEMASRDAPTPSTEESRADSDIVVESSGSSARFQREGEYWTIAYDRGTFRLRDSRGLRYIAQLLRYPGREFHANELEARSESFKGVGLRPREGAAVSDEELSDAGLHSDGPGDAGEMLDASAKKAYRRRLQELREGLDEAKARGDANRAAAMEQEIAFLARELSRAVGLGGRDRRAASGSQRSRINVTRAIRRAIEKMRPHSPSLAGLLARRIKTGMLCVYRPDQHMPVAWEL